MRTIVPINVPAWWLFLMPVLIIILIGIIVLIVNNIVNTKQKKKDDNTEGDYNKSSKDKTLTSWIKKKDLLYWLLIICLGTISLFTFRYKDATELISHWSFAGTIVSIILAVVAIGFTLFQTLSSNLSSEKIAVSAEKIEKATFDLDIDILKQSGKVMIDSATFLKEKISVIEDELKSINNVQKSLSESISNFGINYTTDTEIETKNKNLIDITSFVEKVVPELPYYTKLFVYTSFRLSVLSNYNKKDSFKIFSDTILKYEDKILDTKMGGIFEGINMGAQASVHSFLISLGIINEFKELPISNQDSIIQKIASHFDDDLLESIDTVINELLIKFS